MVLATNHSCLSAGWLGKGRCTDAPTWQVLCKSLLLSAFMKKQQHFL